MTPSNLPQLIVENWQIALVALLIAIPISWKLVSFFYQLRIEKLKHQLHSKTRNGIPRSAEVRDDEAGKSIYFPDSVDDFYKYYARRSEEAREEIWVTSDGYNWQNPRSRKYGDLMMQARCRALARGVSINWFQILSTMHLNWLPQLRKIKHAYPNKFHVYINRSRSSVANMCVIDPESPNSVTERMEHRTGTFGQGSEAVTASFVHGHLGQAKKTKELIKEVIEDNSTKQLSVDDLDALENEIFRERLTQLEQWCKNSHPSDSSIADSGVFDEKVIEYYLKAKR